jgi:hypothetical protein
MLSAKRALLREGGFLQPLVVNRAVQQLDLYGRTQERHAGVVLHMDVDRLILQVVQVNELQVLLQSERYEWVRKHSGAWGSESVQHAPPPPGLPRAVAVASHPPSQIPRARRRR